MDKEMVHTVRNSEDCQIIHLDIKDCNSEFSLRQCSVPRLIPPALLGNDYRTSRLSGYPVAKMSDWGLAQFTGENDRRNPKEMYYGTCVWMPPEAQQSGRLDKDWEHPVITHLGRPFDKQHGVWVLGAMMWGILCQRTNNRNLYDMLEELQTNPRAEAQMEKQGYSLLKGIVTNWTYKNYSAKLIKLIADCLNLSPVFRPTPDQVLQRCEDGIRHEARRLELNGWEKPKVFCGKDGLRKLQDYARKKQRRF
jgi:serine/threonine protein kinase